MPTPTEIRLIRAERLLEAATPAERAAMLIALLQMGAHGTPSDDAPPRGRLS